MSQPVKELRERVALNMRRLRAAACVSQEALGDAAGLHRTFIGQVERSESNVSIDNLEKIAAALKVDGSELLRPLGR